MATKTKTKKPADITIAPEAKPVRLKKDGTPWAYVERVYTPKRPDAEILADLTAKRAAFVDASTKTVAKLDKRIARLATLGTSNEDTAKELLGEGMTPAEIDALIAKLQKGKKALAGKTDAEVEALRLEALSAKQMAENDVPVEVPVFLTPAG